MAEEEKVGMDVPPETGNRETDVREADTQTYAMYTCGHYETG